MIYQSLAQHGGAHRRAGGQTGNVAGDVRPTSQVHADEARPVQHDEQIGVGDRELRIDIPPVSAKVLSQRLRELEGRGVIQRVVLPTSPPSVEYSLTPLGRSSSLRSAPSWK